MPHPALSAGSLCVLCLCAWLWVPAAFAQTATTSTIAATSTTSTTSNLPTTATTAANIVTVSTTAHAAHAAHAANPKQPSTAQQAPPTDAVTCGDFLARLHRKPAGLEWTGCTEGHLHQLRALIATYRVPGARAAGVERYLARHTGMERLRYVCCGWEPGSRARQQGVGHLPGPGEAYIVEMGSGETLVTRRSGWAQIPWFEVRVTLPLESP